MKLKEWKAKRIKEDSRYHDWYELKDRASHFQCRKCDQVIWWNRMLGDEPHGLYVVTAIDPEDTLHCGEWIVRQIQNT